ncbi:uncharacterized protein BJ171DRAFT_488652 [Polychytrium aggregatum]|uniref:uncharacterized protein n=1 Tax=Polychytrium aggregatum TaxID=110093 RepID=UPI0022FE2D7F|nr:uncharacterized protein BJ171DRAFT_488652 [Polychytrium aggregatum]KAI9209154.1 hypothetical protein BJ171DRAFT_488652 [Polychytrium aggregatum]
MTASELSCLDTDPEWAPLVGLDLDASDFAPNGSVRLPPSRKQDSSQTTADVLSPSHIQTLAHHDLVVVLICNPSFLDHTDLPTLFKLSSLARRHRNLLALVPFDHLKRCTARDLHIWDDVFENVEGTFRRLEVLQGLVHFCTRKRGYPRSIVAHQKESAFWEAVVQSEILRANVRKFVHDPFGSMDWLCVCKVEKISLDNVASLGPKQQFSFVDASNIAYQRRCRWCRYAPESLAVVRLPSHPLHTDEQWSQLLLHERWILQRADEKRLRLINCTFLSISGWPRSLDGVVELDLQSCTPDGDAIRLAGFPELPNVQVLRLPAQAVDLSGLPRVLPMLLTLDMSRCSRLASLAGLPRLPTVQEVRLPISLESLEGLDETLPSLTRLDMSGCNRLATLRGFPTLPDLRSIKFPETLETLEGLPPSLDNTEHFHIVQCAGLKSLRGMPAMSKIRKLKLPRGLESTQGMPGVLQSLVSLDMSRCDGITVLSELPEMPSLKEIRLSRMLTDLETLPPAIRSIHESGGWMGDERLLREIGDEYTAT